MHSHTLFLYSVIALMWSLFENLNIYALKSLLCVNKLPINLVAIVAKFLWSFCLFDWLRILLVGLCLLVLALGSRTQSPASSRIGDISHAVWHHVVCSVCGQHILVFYLSVGLVWIDDLCFKENLRICSLFFYIDHV